MGPVGADLHCVEVVVIGGGQAGLAAGYYLRRSGLSFVILDGQTSPGGAWQHGWDSLRLFSPAVYNPLPGWAMPPQDGELFPTADHVVGYLEAYERRYDLPVRRPVHVGAVHEDGPHLRVDTDAGTWRASFVINATGTWDSPFVPALPGAQDFRGRHLHTVSYSNPLDLTGQRVVVVGGGNSAAQILAEVSTVAETLWVTREPPRFMPDDVDGRVLFDVETQRASDTSLGRATEGLYGLGDIVMVPSVKTARRRGVLHAEPLFDRITPTGVAWHGGRQYKCETLIWCTGFRPTLGHLAPLGLRRGNNLPRTVGTQSLDEPRLFLLSHGSGTERTSATIIGVGHSAKKTVTSIMEHAQEHATANAQ